MSGTCYGQGGTAGKLFKEEKVVVSHPSLFMVSSNYLVRFRHPIHSQTLVTRIFHTAAYNSPFIPTFAAEGTCLCGRDFVPPKTKP